VLHCPWLTDADIDWIVCALLYDTGDTLTPCNHSQLAAAVIEPYEFDRMRLNRSPPWRVSEICYEHHVGLDSARTVAFEDFCRTEFLGSNASIVLSTPCWKLIS